MSQQLCKLSEIGEHGKEIALRNSSGAVYIMLFHHNGEVRAFLNVCPHQGRPLNLSPDRFVFTPEGSLMCPHHGACFRIKDGECIEGPCLGSVLRKVEVKQVDEMVYLESAVEDLPG